MYSSRITVGEEVGAVVIAVGRVDDLTCDKDSFRERFTRFLRLAVEGTRLAKQTSFATNFNKWPPQHYPQVSQEGWGRISCSRTASVIYSEERYQPNANESRCDARLFPPPANNGRASLLNLLHLDYLLESRSLRQPLCATPCLQRYPKTAPTVSSLRRINRVAYGCI